MKQFKSLIPTLLIFLFEAAIGTLLIIAGGQFPKVIFMVFGGLLILGALVNFIRGLIAKKNSEANQPLSFSAAVIMAIIGIFFIAAADIIMPALTLILGIIMAINGFFKLSEFFYIRRTSPISGLTVLNAIITIILGFVIAFNPFEATGVMWKIMGVLIVVSAVLDLIALIYLAVVLKKKTADMVEAEGKEVNDTKQIKG